MTKKLLTKTTRRFLLFAVLILIISAPLFYYMSHWLYVYETDEVLTFHKDAFVQHNLPNFSQGDINVWNKYNRDVEIIPDTGIKKDSIFGTRYFDPIANEVEPYRELWAPIEINGKRYTYIERNNLVEMEDMVYTVALMFLLIIILLLIGIIILSNRMAKNIWLPFYDTLQQIQNFEIDKKELPVFKETDIEEFLSLQKSIKKLIDKNLEIYKSQREFIENAAHELQTPLALFQSKIDNLSQNPNLTKEQSLLISALDKDIARMRRLNKKLLLLSKIDNDSFFEKNEITINDYINKNLDFFIEQCDNKNLKVELNFYSNIVVNTNPILLEVLINNLFINAINHNIQSGKITITTKENKLIFSNTGENPALDTDKLFNRFSKATSSVKGNGLGLAIVKKIIELNGWEIGYNYQDSLHQFIIEF